MTMAICMAVALAPAALTALVLYLRDRPIDLERAACRLVLGRRI